ncbi:flavanone 3-dioxygenase 3 [Diospyros lotus]|uniref:flavanone 3-dioxygenase 3 n=1 Tax=Diospyros lotus TaxID=55363 RepID=UPI00225517F2|nr:flavanone 3-dioxygenase 3 [Diospyros lotus]
MESDEKNNSSSFPIGETAQEKGLSHVPEAYEVPSSQRPSLEPETADVPLIDLNGLRCGGAADRRGAIVEEIGQACRRYGFFQVVNHGIDQAVLEGALSAASDFFSLPAPEKIKFFSNDVHKPVRYASSLKDGVDTIQFWRIFLKHYAHPLGDWINSWPANPPTYREEMGRYAMEVRKLGLELMEAITESLGIGPKYTSDKMEQGMQVMAINCYPPCPQPSLALGLPPHSDYSCLTVLLQSFAGLEIFDSKDGQWQLVPDVDGALQVHVGNHLEVLSNGRFKSVVHRASLHHEKTRISIASLHSLAMDEKMGTAMELVDEEHPKGYKESSLRDFLDFLAKHDLGQGKSFIKSLQI